MNEKVNEPQTQHLLRTTAKISVGTIFDEKIPTKLARVGAKGWRLREGFFKKLMRSIEFVSP